MNDMNEKMDDNGEVKKSDGMKSHANTAIKTAIKALVILVIVLLGFKFSPLLFQKKVNESRSEVVTSTSQQIFKGTFSGLGTFKASGDAELIKDGNKYSLSFSDKFKAEIGPDTHIFFGKDGVRDEKAEIAVLKGSEGSQNYEIPSQLNPNNYNEIWIHCNQVSVDFAKAVLAK